jgi:hypothetical protein
VMHSTTVLLGPAAAVHRARQLYRGRIPLPNSAVHACLHMSNSNHGAQTRLKYHAVNRKAPDTTVSTAYEKHTHKGC